MSARPPRLILSNSVYLGISFAAKVLLYTLLARQLARSDVGVLLYGVALLELALGVSSFGVPQLAIREISSGHTGVSAFFANLLLIRAVFALLALGAVALALGSGVLLPAHDQPTVVLVIALAVLPKTLSECLDVLFAVSEQFVFPAIVETVSNALFVAGCLLLVVSGLELQTIAWFYVAVSCVAALARGLLLRGRVVVRVRDLSLRSSRQILRQLAPFGLFGLTLVVYLRVGDVLLVKLSPGGIDELASFKMAHMPVVFLIGLLSASVMPFYGNVTRLGRSTDPAATPELARRLHQTLRAVLVLGGLSVLGPAVFAEPLLVAVCGAAWASSGPLLVLLLCHAPLPPVTSIIGRALQATGREGPLAMAGLGVLVIKLCALWVVLPGFGAAGLAAVTVGAAIVYVVAVSVLAWPLLKQPGGSRVARTAAILLVALALAYVRPAGSNAADAGLAYAALLGLLVLTKSVTVGELAQLLRRRVPTGSPAED
jgi:O-antigen/teichoic acid export membrane protein